MHPSDSIRAFDLDTIAAGLPAAALIEALAEAAPGPFPRFVVHAPPGTGKTTIMPPLVAEHISRAGAGDAGGTGGSGSSSGRVIVTQPRRMAARAAARRLAQLSRTRLGEEVGFTVRGESKTSAATRIEFVTTGVLLARLLREPELPGVSAIILDEVHERQLDTDLTFALCRELVELREDLSLAVMSATLDAEEWSKRLGGAEVAPVLSVAAATHPLEIRWAPPTQRGLDVRGVTRDFLDHMARTTLTALNEHADGDVLVFAPGAREVEEVAARVSSRLGGLADGPGVTVHTLTGRTPAQEQDAILRPRAATSARESSPSNTSDGRRVIVSTSVAESALTVPGVSIVIDSGLARGPRLDTRRSMSGLVTMRESKASGTQRSGRAARLGPGVAYRCLSEADWASLPEHTAPEITTSDLTAAVLALAVSGADPDLLPTPMPAATRRLAVSNLAAIGAVDDLEMGVSGLRGSDVGVSELRVTELGRKIARIPASVWSARGLLDGAAMLGAGAAATAIAVIESERRAPGGDLAASLRELRRSGDRRFKQDVDRFARLAKEATGRPDPRSPRDQGSAHLSPDDLGLVVALAFPRQIARVRGGSAASGGAGSGTGRTGPGTGGTGPGAGPEFLLASGTAARLPRDSSLQGSQWLAISEVGLAGSQAIIRAAVPIDQETAELAGSELLTTRESASFGAGKVRALRRTCLGEIELTATPISPSPELARTAIAASVDERGAKEVLRPSPAFENLRARLGLLHAVFGDPWPDVSWARLGATLPRWCPAALDRIAKGADPAKVDLVSTLRTLLPWPDAAHLDALVPESLTVPSGSLIRLDYPDPDTVDPDQDGAQSPVLAVKLQECFGWEQVPRICADRVPVIVHLLSPARRPLAVTSDLASFWANAYAQVRAENRGRYPKHPWPEDPLEAPAMRGTKRSGTMKR